MKDDIKKAKRHLRYTFSEKELLELARNLGEKNNEASELEEAKKRVTSDFKAKIDAATSEITTLSRKVTSGYEFRDVECELRYGKPKRGQKEVWRMDTGELVGVENMTSEELQREMDLRESDEPQPEEVNIPEAVTVES